MRLAVTIDLFFVAARADGLRDKSVKWYSQSLKPFAAFLGDRELESVTLDDLRRFLAGLHDRETRWGSGHPRIATQKGGLSPFTIQGYLRSLKRFFNFCVESEYLKPSQNPAARLKRQRLPRVAPKEISDDDLRLLLDASRRSAFPERDHALVLFLAGTGCRVGGVVGLRLADLDLDLGRAVVTEKGEKSRRVFLDSSLVDALREWLSVRQGNCDFVFVTKRGTPCMVSTVELVLKRLARSAGVQGRFNPHSFRHRYAKRYLMNGGDLASLSRLLGHYDVSVTSEFYTIFCDDELQKKQEEHSPLRGIEGGSNGS